MRHIDILRSGVEKWNQWRQANPGVRIDLTGADLTGADLRWADLSGTNLTCADLEGSVGLDE